MPEISDATMVDRQIPPLRRLLAVLVDVAAIAIPTVTVAMVLAERFKIIDDLDGKAFFSDPDQLRINEIDQGFNRALRLGDTVVTLSGSGWWLTMLTLITLTVALFVVLPSKLERRTPGRMALGLPAAMSPDFPSASGSVTASPDSLAVVDPTGADRHFDPPATIGPDPEADSPEVDRLEMAMTTTGTIEPDTSLAGRTAPAESPPDTGERVPELRPSLADAEDYLTWDRDEANLPRRTTSRIRSGNMASSFSALNLPESSLAETTLHASTMVENRPTESTGSPESPIWSDVWDAWIYQDPKSDRWFRHDTDRNKWLPIR